jgi:sugar lactone lactonase YvrE
MKKSFWWSSILVLGAAIGACTPPVPPVVGIGPTGGVVTTPNNTASLTIPAGTFTAPVDIKLEPIVTPPIPLEYTALTGGSFQMTAPNEFVADQDVTLEIEDSALSTANGARITPQTVPAGSLVVMLAKRPSDSSYLMKTVKRKGSKWFGEVFKGYICKACEYLLVLFKPTSISISISDVPEEAAVQATMIARNKNGQQVTPSVTWSVLDTNVATVDSSTGLVTGKNQGTTELSAFYSATVNAKTTLKVTAKPVLFAANYNTGVIKGFAKGQLATSGSPTPIVTITLPNGAKPNDLAFDPSGNLWVTNNAGNQLLSFTPSQYNQTGTPTPSIIIDTDANNSLSSPLGLNFDSSGNLWVSNEGIDSLVRFSASSLTSSGVKTPDRKITQGLNFPAGIAVDLSNNLWVANFDGNNVLRFTPSEQQANTASTYVLNQSLVKPTGLEFDSSGNLYVGQEGAPSGISVFTAAQLNAPTPSAATRVIGLGVTNKIYGLARDNSTGTIWANNQGDGAAIAYTTTQLAQTNPAATAPSVSIGGATQASIGYGGVAFANGGAAPAPKPSINSFAADKLNLPAGGGNVILSWNVTGATSLSINNGVGVVTGSSKSVNVSATTAFVLTATNANGSVDSSTVTINVASNAGNKLSLWIPNFRRDSIKRLDVNAGGVFPGGVANEELSLPTVNLGLFEGSTPNSLTFDPDGNMWVARALLGNVVKISKADLATNPLVISNTINVGGNPVAIKYTNNQIWVTLDSYGAAKNRVRAFNTAGIQVAEFTNGLAFPAGLAFDNIGNLWVSNASSENGGIPANADKIVKFNKARLATGDANAPDAIISSVAVAGNNNQESLKYPEGIVFDQAGNLWVANNRNDGGATVGTIVRYTPAQQVTGSPVPSAVLVIANSQPGGLAIDPLDGNLWVNDQRVGAFNPGNDNGDVKKYNIINFPSGVSTPAALITYTNVTTNPGNGGLAFGNRP